MIDGTILKWLPYAFPVFFVGMWLVATTMTGFLSGWYNLQQWYPDEGGEEPLLTLNMQSGSMGAGVALNGILKLRSYQSGLGLSMLRIFAPFQKSLKVPWSEIEAEPSRSFFLPMVKLSLGKPANGRLKISARSWSRLVDSVSASPAGRPFQMPVAVPVSAEAFARALIAQWVVMSVFAAAFFAFLWTRMPPGAGVPLALCVGLPITCFGIAQLIRYGREG
jgi:hypothetical protein